jgi:uncharacterized protein (TIGR01777 family)
MKILVTGSSGFIGSSLVPFLSSHGHEVYKLVRTSESLAADEKPWDPDRGILEPAHLEGFDAIVNLAGENIGDSRWTEEKKKKILDSRVIGTRLLCRALEKANNPPKILVNASAIGFYGDRNDEILTEDSPTGSGFIAEVCSAWEAAADQAKQLGIRVVKLRLGMVLSPKGGALQKILKPFKLGFGGILGTGQQYVSWIALDDLLNITLFAIQDQTLQGAVNAVSPHPVTNKEFTKILGHVLHRPTVLPLPAFAARMMFGEMADELLLSSAQVLPKRLLESGYSFIYPDLEQALIRLLKEEISIGAK